MILMQVFFPLALGEQFKIRGKVYPVHTVVAVQLQVIGFARLQLDTKIKWPPAPCSSVVIPKIIFPGLEGLVQKMFIVEGAYQKLIIGYLVFERVDEQKIGAWVQQNGACDNPLQNW